VCVAVGGTEVSVAVDSAIRVSGTFVTIVGPVRYIGSQKLSLLQAIKVLGYVLWRVVPTKFSSGPGYVFGENSPVLSLPEQ